MPHAALWVVQPGRASGRSVPALRFNAARGFVGGAAQNFRNSQTLSKMFQCRTRLCGWCSREHSYRLFGDAWFQCRTRLCGWCSGGARSERNELCGVSMPHAALWVVQLCHECDKTFCRRFQCRTRLCGWCNNGFVDEQDVDSVFQCRTRLCGWCNFFQWIADNDLPRFNAARGFVGGATRKDGSSLSPRCRRFNAARGFVGGATRKRVRNGTHSCVSMPHAALWVVQPHRSQPLSP